MVDVNLVFSKCFHRRFIELDSQDRTKIKARLYLVNQLSKGKVLSSVVNKEFKAQYKSLQNEVEASWFSVPLENKMKLLDKYLIITLKSLLIPESLVTIKLCLMF